MPRRAPVRAKTEEVQQVQAPDSSAAHIMGTRTLAAHQLRAVEALEARPAVALFYQAGTGKTVCVLTALRDLALQGAISTALVVCPAALVPMWRKAISDVTLFKGFTVGDALMLGELITIQSVSSVWARGTAVTHHRDGSTDSKRIYRIRPAIDRPWDVIVVDESHCLGSRSSVQTLTMLKLGGHAARRWILSGTPDSGARRDTKGNVVPDYAKLYPQIRFLDPDRWPTWSAFIAECVVSCDPWGNPYRYRAERCEDAKRTYGLVARLDDCFDLPPVTETDLPCPLAEPSFLRDLLAGRCPYPLTVESPSAVMLKGLQVCSGHVKADDGIHDLRCAKDDAFLTVLAGTDEPLVVFCTFRRSIDRVLALCAKAGRTALRFDGSTEAPVWRDFQEGRGDVLVTQYQRGGVGIDLYRAHAMLFWEPTFSVTLLDQARARIHRKGQDHPCRYLYLTTPGTIEARIWATVRSGVEVTNALLDEWAHEADVKPS